LHEKERNSNKGRCKDCSAIVPWSREKVASHKRRTCTALNASRQETLNNIEAIDYWKLVGATDFLNLSKIAIDVCGIHCSSAASERIWSTYRFIHSRLRNRLTNDKIEKMIFIYENSSILDDCDNEDYFCDELSSSLDEINA
jgi:hypothetical protein